MNLGTTSHTRAESLTWTTTPDDEGACYHPSVPLWRGLAGRAGTNESDASVEWLLTHLLLWHKLDPRIELGQPSRGVTLGCER